jgi:uncharacterized membrane protein
MVETLTMWRFEGPSGAEAALPRLERLAAGGVIAVDDAALVAWPETVRKPSLRQLGSLVGPGMLWGGFWGVLLGLIFLVPIAGPAFGAAAGAFAGSLASFGVEDDLVKRVRDAVVPGTSALFVLSSGAAADALTTELRAPGVEMLRYDLAPEQSRRLREALGEERLRTAS